MCLSPLLRPEVKSSVGEGEYLQLCPDSSPPAAGPAHGQREGEEEEELPYEAYELSDSQTGVYV